MGPGGNLPTSAFTVIQQPSSPVRSTAGRHICAEDCRHMMSIKARHVRTSDELRIRFRFIYDSFGFQTPRTMTPNAAHQQRRAALTSARHVHNEMTHLPRACDALSPSAATACYRGALGTPSVRANLRLLDPLANRDTKTAAKNPAARATATSAIAPA
jgi:hypothetical protein